MQRVGVFFAVGRDINGQLVQIVDVVSVSRHRILSGTLPSEDDSPVDADLRAQIDSPKWFVNIIVIHDGTVRQVCVHLAVNSQVRMAISPLRPGVALVVHPRFLTKGLVGNATGTRVDLQETGAALAFVAATDNAGSHANLAMPRYRVKTDVTGGYWRVEIVSSLSVLVHVSPEYFRLEMVEILVEKPDIGVVGI